MQMSILHGVVEYEYKIRGMECNISKECEPSPGVYAPQSYVCSVYVHIKKIILEWHMIFDERTLIIRIQK